MAVHAALPARTGHYDELRGMPTESGDTLLRGPWARFFELLGREGFADLDHRAEAVARQIRENGITYNIYADANGPTRPWSLDLLPFIINDTDWAIIEKGLTQRAGLLNQVLADVYGEQSLLTENLLPPALVFGHPGYLRPLRGYRPPGDVYMHIAAFDLARAEDGGWWVVSQRTQAPSGLGYLLENRLTVSGLFPEAFKELHVQHLASSYRRLMDMLYRLSPVDKSAHTPPRIVLLTPGPYNETYFEQTYLARYLGLTLVEGSDLVVRDNLLFLKTLHGLERVHAVLRRLDDDFCDPLELRSDSTLGIPGLLQVMRAGNVLVANSLGASFLESPAINGFLPALSRRLLNEDLLLPSLPSWWCGETAAREQVMPTLTGAVVKSTFPNSRLRPGFEPVIGGAATEEELAALRTRVHQEPDAFTIQEYLPLSQAPSWSHGHIVPRAAMVRMFVIADGKGGWSVLPGGLTRIASREQQIVSMQRGGSSMDTWVTTADAVDTFSMLPEQMTPDELIVGHRPVSSRAAENLFWMGRYTERAENEVRLASVTLTWLNGDQENSEALFAAVASMCRRSGLVPGAETPSPRVFEYTMVDELASVDSHRGVNRNLGALAFTASQIRDRLSPDHWRLVVSAQDSFFKVAAAGRVRDVAPDAAEIPASPAVFSTSDILPALKQLGTHLSAITGAQADRMTRDDGWRLLAIGRQTERLATMVRILGDMFKENAVLCDSGFGVLLDLFDSAITYRAYYPGRQEIPAVLNLLVLEPANPRSIACVLRVLRRQLERLPNSAAGPTRDLLKFFPEAGVGMALTQLCERNESGLYAELLLLVECLDTAANALSNEISRRYFSHVAGSHLTLSV